MANRLNIAITLIDPHRPIFNECNRLFTSTIASSSRFAAVCRSYYNPPVKIRDKRTVGEQVKSGFRLVGWLLLTLAFIYALLLCAGFLVGKGEYNQPIYRVAGACGLVALSVVMLMTVRHWVGWFIGALGYFVLKTAFALLLGSSLVRPRLWFIEFALLLGFAILLCVRYASRKPQRIVAVGLGACAPFCSSL